MATASNWERYSNPATDALIDRCGPTTNAATLRAIIKKLEAMMVNFVPVTPITEGVDWCRIAFCARQCLRESHTPRAGLTASGIRLAILDSEVRPAAQEVTD
jgi:hypothetical protein